MTSYTEAKAFHAAAEANFDAVCVKYQAALNACRRSKSAKNRAALAEIGQDHEDMARICREAQDRMERAATVERRLVLVADRRALRAKQLSFF